MRRTQVPADSKPQPLPDKLNQLKMLFDEIGKLLATNKLEQHHVDAFFLSGLDVTQPFPNGKFLIDCLIETDNVYGLQKLHAIDPLCFTHKKKMGMLSSLTNRDQTPQEELYFRHALQHGTPAILDTLQNLGIRGITPTNTNEMIFLDKVPETQKLTWLIEAIEKKADPKNIVWLLNNMAEMNFEQKWWIDSKALRLLRFFTEMIEAKQIECVTVLLKKYIVPSKLTNSSQWYYDPNGYSNDKLAGIMENVQNETDMELCELLLNHIALHRHYSINFLFLSDIPFERRLSFLDALISRCQAPNQILFALLNKASDYFVEVETCVKRLPLLLKDAFNGRPNQLASFLPALAILSQSSVYTPEIEPLIAYLKQNAMSVQINNISDEEFVNNFSRIVDLNDIARLERCVPQDNYIEKIRKAIEQVLDAKQIAAGFELFRLYYTQDIRKVSSDTILAKFEADSATIAKMSCDDVNRNLMEKALTFTINRLKALNILKGTGFKFYEANLKAALGDYQVASKMYLDIIDDPNITVPMKQSTMKRLVDLILKGNAVIDGQQDLMRFANTKLPLTPDNTLDADAAKKRNEFILNIWLCRHHIIVETLGRLINHDKIAQPDAELSEIETQYKNSQQFILDNLPAYMELFEEEIRSVRLKHCAYVFELLKDEQKKVKAGEFAITERDLKITSLENQVAEDQKIKLEQQARIEALEAALAAANSSATASSYPGNFMMQLSSQSAVTAPATPAPVITPP